MKQLILFIWLACSVLFAGCSQETELIGSPSPADKRVRISFHTDAGSFTKPLTRMGSAAENDWGTSVWVYVFKGVPNVDKTLATVEKVNITPAGTVSLLLEPTAAPVTLVLVANAPDTYLDKFGNERPFGDIAVNSYVSFIELKEDLNTALLSIPQQTVPYTDGTPLPMSGEINLPGGIPDTNTDLGTISLKRIVAKITVENKADLFTLEGATVGNAPRSGYFLAPRTEMKNNTNNLTDYVASAAPDATSAIAQAVTGNGDVKQTTAPNPVYIYESRTEEGTFVIIKGKFGNNAATYYKLRMTQPYLGSDLVEYPANCYKRNFAYKFIVTEITGNGYPTLDIALQSLPSNNIRATLDVTDLSSHDIIDNGEYYLGVSNSELILYTSDDLANFQVCKVLYSGPASSGNSVSIIDEAGASPTILSSPASEDLTMTFPAGFISCKVVLRYGNLTRVIPIRREGGLSNTGLILDTFHTPAYVYGIVSENRIDPTSWIGFSVSDNPAAYPFPELANNNNGLYLIIKPNNSAARNATLYLSRNNEEGRLKIYVEQDSAIN